MHTKLLSIKTILWISVSLLFVNCEQSTPNHSKEDIQKNQQNSWETPNELVFFNERIPLTDFDLRERLDRELLVNTYFQSSTSLAIKRSTRYFPIIEGILKQEGVPQDFKYLCVIESNLCNVTSPAGAGGFWQFMPSTAPEYGIKITSEIDERNHLEISTRAACRLIKNNYALFKDWVNACAAYNRGPGGLLQDMKSQGVKHFFDTEMNPETARYIFRIMALKLIMANPSDFGYNIPRSACYTQIKTKNIKINHPIKNIAIWAKQKGTTLKNIKILNPWILTNELTAKSIPCTIALPSNKHELGVFKN
ncbi:MAG: transglycosylase SLT domain-containing protein [Flavobacteriales bacterium]